MGQRIAASSERGLTTTVSEIEHIESTSLPSVTVLKVFFHPRANIQTAIAQSVAAVQTQVRQLPRGISPPLVIKYSASSIPVVQLALSSGTLPEQSVFDAAVNTLGPRADDGGQRQVAQLLGQRLLVSVLLVKAVGGDW